MSVLLPGAVGRSSGGRAGPPACRFKGLASCSIKGCSVLRGRAAGCANAEAGAFAYEEERALSAVEQSWFECLHYAGSSSLYLGPFDELIVASGVADGPGGSVA